MNLKRIGALLKGIAPTIAGTLITGNPASGAALGGLIGDMLGIDKSDPEAGNQIIAKLQNPVEVERIRAQLEQAELTHAQEMARIALELHKVDAETDRDNYAQDVLDRTSAREMYISTGEQTPKHVTWFVCFLWICMAVAMFYVDLPSENRELIIRMQGTLEGAVATIIAFWVGSSHGSRSKDDAVLNRNWSKK